MGRKIIYSLPIALFLALIIVAAAALLRGEDPSKIQSPLVNKPMPSFEIEGLTNKDIKAPALINFFASWCIPCEAEHKTISALANNFPVYGINYKDEKTARDKFLKRLGNPYIKTGDDKNGIAAIAFGVYGVPSSFVINENNIIIYRHDAPLTEDDIKTIRGYLK